MRRRMYLVSVSVTLVLTATFAVPLLLFAHENAVSEGLTALRDQATSLALAVRGRSDDEVGALLTDLDRTNATRTLVLRGGATFGSLPAGLRSAELAEFLGAGTVADPSPDPLGAASAVVAVDAGHLAFGVDAADRVRVAVYSADDAFTRDANGRYLLVAALCLLSVLCAASFGQYLVRWISSPLLAAAAAARRLSAGDFSARAATSGPPEVAEVAHALNLLAGRIDELVAEEREVVADLSHRLRTPLTALRLEADALPDSADAERIADAVDALERTLDAVIRAARRVEEAGLAPECDAAAVVRERVEFWAPLAEDQQRVLTSSIPDRRLPVRMLHDDLGAAVDALVENVMAHTPEATGLDVTVRPHAAGGAELVVTDGGPGIPAGALVRGASSRSTGLGLSIAARSAQRSGGSLDVVAAPGGGGRVNVVLGPAHPRDPDRPTPRA